MSQDDTDLQLLLTDAEELVPVLEGGLPESSLTGAPAPGGPRGKESMELAAPDRDPNDLPAQRWGVIAPLGEEGDKALKAIEALIDHRKAQQGTDPKVYRVASDMDAAAAIRWRSDVLRAEGVPEDERPHYLLILGDLHQVSLELQHVLAACALVGRLHCPTLAGYRGYAEKVVAREKSEPVDRGRSLFYTVQDGTSAIQTGYSRLIEPCMAMTGEWAESGKLDLSGVHEIPFSDWGPDDMLTAVGADEPSVLLSLSHGLGAPRKGWRSPDQQRALQGALSMGLESPLAADSVRETAFLPGGVWMCVACFAAGTPDVSAFHPWLAYLAEQGGDGAAVKAVLKSLPRPGERPFVAALPQALLANPRGPLAVIGHMDLAWTFGFTDPSSKKSRASRVFSALRVLLAGSRVGVGVDALMSVYRETNDDLTSRYQLQRDALARGQPDPVQPRALGQLWMQRNDLRGYVLLGDPAARLPVKSDLPSLAGKPRASARARPPEVAAAPPVAAAEPVAKPAAAPVAAAEAVAKPAVPPVAAAEAVEPSPAAAPVAASEAVARPSPSPSPSPAAAPGAASEAVARPSPAAAPVAEAAAKPPPAATPSPEAVAATPAPGPTFVSPAPPQHVPVRSHLSRSEAPMSTQSPPDAPPGPTVGAAYPPGYGAAPLSSVTRPRTLENPEIALRERAVLAMIRGDEAPRSIAVRFGLPLEEIFYWLDVYREAGRRALAG